MNGWIILYFIALAVVLWNLADEVLGAPVGVCDDEEDTP